MTWPFSRRRGPDSRRPPAGTDRPPVSPPEMPPPRGGNTEPSPNFEISPLPPSAAAAAGSRRSEWSGHGSPDDGAAVASPSVVGMRQPRGGRRICGRWLSTRGQIKDGRLQGTAERTNGGSSRPPVVGNKLSRRGGCEWYRVESTAPRGADSSFPPAFSSLPHWHRGVARIKSWRWRPADSSRRTKD